MLGILIIGLTGVTAVSAQDVDYSQFVNPFIGSEGAISGYACTSLYPALLLERGLT
jgi:hypothetical protein